MFTNSYRGKRVLVTGHTGFKGSWMSQWLIDLGADVAGFSIDVPSQPSHFELLSLPNQLQDFRADIRDYDALAQIFERFQPEVVFHLAAQAIVRASYDDPRGNFDINVGGTVNLLECVRQNPAVQATVIVTSDKCYENQERDYAYLETDPLGGKDPYSASKGAAEIVFSSYSRSFFVGSKTQVASARAGNVIGGGDWAKDRIVPDCVRSWSQGVSVQVRNPKSTRPWQHVLEPISGYLWLGAKLLDPDASQAGESFNFGPSPEANQTVTALVEEMSKTWSDARWYLDPSGSSKKPEAALLNLSIEKAARRLSWGPTLTFSETVQMTAEWYQRFYASKACATSEQIRRYERVAADRGQVWAG